MDDKTAWVTWGWVKGRYEITLLRREKQTHNKIQDCRAVRFLAGN